MAKFKSQKESSGLRF